MDLKRYFRGPFVAVLVMLLLFFIVFAYANRGVSYTPASTSRVVGDIYAGHVKSATLIDKNQTIEIVTDGNPSQRLQASWVGNLRSRTPASVAICTMLRKPSAAQMDSEVTYTGFDVPDEFVVGYGLDYAERYRNLPFIGTLAPEVYGGNTSR